jgi:thymidylate synthase
MLTYLSQLESILSTGKPKKERGHYTKGVFALHFDFDLSTGTFPLLTTRKLKLSSIAAELFCFLHGVTSKRTFRDMGTTIWDEWCNPIKVAHVPVGPDGNDQRRREAQQEEDDLGPIYGFQWRSFGQYYQYAYTTLGHVEHSRSDHAGDQLFDILESLRKNPNTRRMVCSAWCPNQAHMQALPPCHVLWNLVHYDGELNLCWHQRSCDMVLGVPYNIASYALLLLLLCKHANLKPGRISGTLADAHIYLRDPLKETRREEDVVCHLAGIQEQFSRQPRNPPNLAITNLPTFDFFDIFHWKPSDLKLTNYDPHPPIKFRVAV